MILPALGALVGGIAGLYRDGAARGGDAAPMLATAAAVVGALDPRDARFTPPFVLPVRESLRAALADAAKGPLAALASDFERVEPACAWRQNPNYTAGNTGADFLAHYGYVELVGPRGPLVSPTARVGFLLLGPATLYAEHAHPAVEAYHVVGGEGAWWDERLGWRAEPRGALVFHPSGLRHSMCAGDGPLLALYGWIGEIGVEARLTETREERR